MPSRPLFQKADGRWIAAGVILAFFLVLKMASLLLHEPVFELPPFQWFGPMAPYFADIRGVVAGTERLHAGIPPVTADLHDPWNRPFNYPKIWLYTDYLGLNVHTVMAFGYAMGVLFFLAAFFALGRLKPWEGLIAGIFLISYAVMFGLERANIDLIIFALAALALALRRYPYAAAFVIGFAAILKLYPLFALFALVSSDWKKSLRWIGFGFLVFLIGEIDSFHDIITAMSYAPNMRTGTLSFGTTSWGLDLMDRFNRPDLYSEVVIIGSMLFLFAAWIAAWVRPPVLVESLGERDLFAFRLGASLFLGSFVMGTNHDYRLIFVLFCFPFLFRLIAEKSDGFRWATTTLVLSLVYAHWKFLSGETEWHHFILKQATAWALAFCLIAFCIATLPPALQWPRRHHS
jgi:hypothetical protein